MGKAIGRSAIALALCLSAQTLADFASVVRAGDVEAATKLLQRGASVNQRDGLGGTPLHDAAWSGDEPMAELLLKFKADPNAKHREGGSTPLHYAVVTNHPGLVALLLKRGADARLTSAGGATALHLAANRGYVEIIRLLLDAGLPVDLPDASGATALHEAAWKGQAEAATLLLERGAQINARHRTTGSTPLLEAAGKGQAGLVELLLKKGVDSSIRDNEGNSALSIALQVRNGPVAALLLPDGPEAALQVSRALQDAVLRGDSAFVSILLRHKSTKIPRNAPLLHDAALKGHVEIAKVLIAAGFSCDETNPNGNTPLHDAALGGHVELIRVLIDCGARVNAPNTESGATPLHIACSWGREVAAAALLAAGADRSARNFAGQTPSDLARSSGHAALATQTAPQ